MEALPFDEPSVCHCLQDAPAAERKAMLQRAMEAQQEREAKNQVRREWRHKSEASAEQMDIEDRVKLTGNAGNVRRQRRQQERLWNTRVPVTQDRTWRSPTSQASR